MELPGTDGYKVYFCCAKCAEKFQQEPAKYVKNLEEQGLGVDVKALEKQPKKDKPAEKAK
jgi:hypothetical protein